MFSSTFFGPVALLNYLAFLLLAGLALFIAVRGRRRTPARARLRHTFCLLALFLLVWLLTLFLEGRMVRPVAQLWLGRVNFAAVVLAAYLSLRFVQEVPRKAKDPVGAGRGWLRAATALLGLLTLLTPLIDAAERVEAGRAITTYGPLFPVYLVHVFGCLMAALILAFRGWRRADDRRVQRQMAVIGLGMLATSDVALVTNALLPYGWGDFRFCDVGTLSTLLFVGAVAYATFLHGLFDLKVLLRRTLVYGLLLAFVLGTYSSTVFVISQYLTASTGKLTQFAVLLIAFSVDPLRRFLEKKTDHLLFGEPGATKTKRKRRKDGKGERSGSRGILALLFPWRRP
jgi:hypothetical protein